MAGLVTAHVLGQCQCVGLDVRVTSSITPAFRCDAIELCYRYRHAGRAASTECVIKEGPHKTGRGNQMRTRQILFILLGGLASATLLLSIAGGSPGSPVNSRKGSEGGAQFKLLFHPPSARSLADTLGACIYKKYGTQDCLQTTKADCDKVNGQWAQNMKCPGDP